MSSLYSHVEVMILSEFEAYHTQTKDELMKLLICTVVVRQSQ